MRQNIRGTLAWADWTTWGIVNAVNLLQAIGFISRIFTGSMAVNHWLGYFILALGVPAILALISQRRARTGWRQWIGMAVYLAFLALMLGVDYLWPVEFRSPQRPEILVPYLVLFFGAILLMGTPMFRINRRLWLITVLTTLFLLGSMGAAMRMGVG
jgi:hypothetical protein